MQTKTTARDPLISVRMAIIKKTKDPGIGCEDVEKRKLLYAVGGNVNWCSLYGKQYVYSSKN